MKKIISTILIISLMLSNIQVPIANGLNLGEMETNVVDLKNEKDYIEISETKEETTILFESKDELKTDEKAETKESIEEVEESVKAKDLEEPEEDILEDESEGTFISEVNEEEKKEENITEKDIDEKKEEEIEKEESVKAETIKSESEQINETTDEIATEEQKVENEINETDETDETENEIKESEEDNIKISTLSETEEEIKDKNDDEENNDKKEIATKSDLILLEKVSATASTADKIYGDSSEVTINSIGLGKDGILSVKISYPANNSSFRTSDLENNARIEDVIFIDQLIGSEYSISDTWSLGGGIWNSGVVADSSRGEATVSFNLKEVVYQSSWNGDKRWDEFYNEYKSKQLKFNLSLFNGTFTAITRVGTSKVHKWVEGWNDHWELPGSALEIADVVSNMQRKKRIGILYESDITYLSTGSAYGVYNYWESLDYEIFYNDSLELSVAARNDYETSDSGFEDNSMYFILNDGDSLVFDGENSKNLFKNSQIKNVDWRKVALAQTGIDNGLTTMEGWFEGCDFTESLEASGAGEAEDLSTYFTNNSPIRSRLDMFSYLDITNLTSVKNMFKGAKDVYFGSYGNVYLAGTSPIDVTEKYNTQNVVDMSGMFEGAKFNFGKIDEYLQHILQPSVFSAIAKNLNTSNVKNMSNMFKDVGSIYATATNQRDLDISGWIVDSVENTSHMFENSYFSRVIFDEDTWNLSNVTKDTDMFTGALMTGENRSKYGDWYMGVDKTYARRDTYYTPGYFVQVSKSPVEANKLYDVTFSSSANNKKGSQPIKNTDKIYKAVYTAELDTGTVASYESYSFKITGFRVGEVVEFRDSEYDLFKYPKIGDGSKRLNTMNGVRYFPIDTSTSRTADAYYICTGYKRYDGQEVTIDEEKIENFTVAVSSDSYGSTTAFVNHIQIVWVECNRTATFKSDHILTSDVEKKFSEFHRFNPIGDLVKNQIYKEGSDFYKFLYWEKEGTLGEYDFYNNSLGEDDNVVFIAKWQQVNPHTISFSDSKNYIQNISSQYILDGEKAKEPDETKTGFVKNETDKKWTFLYWYENDENIAFDFNAAVTKDIALHAKWKEEIAYYRVSFETDHFGPFIDQMIEYNGKAVDSTNLTEGATYKDGSSYYVFNGFRNAAGQKISEANITSDTTFTASWTSVTGTFKKITILSNHGSYSFERYVKKDDITSVDLNEITYGTKIIEGDKVYQFTGDYNDNINGYGYAFDSWKWDVYYDSATFEDKTFYAIFNEANFGIIKYESDYGTVSPTYKFLKKDSYSVFNSSPVDSETDTKIYYAPNTPKIGDVVEVGGVKKVLTKWQYYIEGDTTLNDLDEYFLSYDDNTMYYDSISYSYENIVFKAVWTDVQEFTVTFTDTHGVNIPAQRVMTAHKAVEPTELSSGDEVEDNGVYYNFYGSWLDESGNYYDFNTIVTGDITLKPEWSSGFIKIKYESDYNTGYKPSNQTVYENNLPYLLSEPNNTNFKKDVTQVESGGDIYKFKYWYATQSTVPFDFSKRISKSVTLNAYWLKLETVTLTYELDPYGFSNTISFRLPNNSTTKSLKVEKSEATNTWFPTQPQVNSNSYSYRGQKYESDYNTNRYYKLRGWKWVDENNIEHTISASANATFNQDTTIHAVWEKQNLSKFYYDLDYNYYTNVEAWYNYDNPSGKTITPPSSYQEDVYVYKDTTNKKAYKLKYWYATDSNVRVDFANERFYDDIVFYPKWEEIPFTWTVTVETKYGSSYGSNRFEGVLDDTARKTYEVADGDTFTLPNLIKGAFYKNLITTSSNNYAYFLGYYVNGTNIGDPPYNLDIVISNNTTVRLEFNNYYNRSLSQLKTVIFKADYINTYEEIKTYNNEFVYVNCIKPLKDETVVDQSTGKSYKMLGWYDESDPSKTIKVPTIVSGSERTYIQFTTDTTMVASYSEITDINISYSDDYKTAPASETIISGQKVVNVPTTHTVGEGDITVGTEKYRFIGWFRQGDIEAFDFNTSLFVDTVIEARYKNVTEYNVTFDINRQGETNPPSQISSMGKHYINSISTS